MAVRVQVIVEEKEKERFQRRAADAGMSLSAWLREAGRQRLVAEESKQKMAAGDLRSFFATCDAREVGHEPSWEEHLAVIEASRGEGRSRT